MKETILVSITQLRGQMDEIKALIAKGDDIVIPNHCTDSVMIIGYTGSGKSTLLNYLSGVEMHARKGPSKISGKLVISEADDTSIINHGTQSETSIPNLRICENRVFVDCPGFCDNRGPYQDLANAYYIKRILKNWPVARPSQPVG